MVQKMPVFWSLLSNYLLGHVRANEVLLFPISKDVKQGCIRGPILLKRPSYITRQYRITRKPACELDSELAHWGNIPSFRAGGTCQLVPRPLNNNSQCLHSSNHVPDTALNTLCSLLTHSSPQRLGGQVRAQWAVSNPCRATSRPCDIGQVTWSTLLCKIRKLGSSRLLRWFWDGVVS